MLPTWYIISSLIIKEGLPVAEAIFAKWTSGKAPTQTDFDELRAISSQSSTDRMKLALAKAGIALDSEQGKLLLSLT